MAGPRKGHTTEEPAQFELEWVPEATPATTDFVCWLWAAFPPKDGRLNIARIAKALEISPTTLRRWIIKDDPKLVNKQVRILHQRAILRGRGTYLWPTLDEGSRRRSELATKTARHNDHLIRTAPDRVAPTWKANGTLDTHEVHVIEWGKAHAFGVAYTTHPKALARLHRFGTILDTVMVPNKYAAIALKQEILARVDEHRCITPKRLVPVGHTETWRAAGGPTSFMPALEVAVVRFGGRLTSFAKVTEALRKANPVPRYRVTEYVVESPAEAAEALCVPADVVILASHGFTEQTWQSKQAWPGGAWFAGGRAPGAPGTSLDELAAGILERGLEAKVLVIDTEEAAATQARLAPIAAKSGTQLLLRAKGRPGAKEISDLNRLLQQAHEHRENTEDAIAGIERYLLAAAD